jgi:hypothetical protein
MSITYFHGTNADLSVGDILIPGTQLPDVKDHGRSEHVYLTWDAFIVDEDDEVEGFSSEDIAIREAYSWARVACSVAEDEGSEKDQQAFVYVVEPVTAVEQDAAGDVGPEAVRTTAARIIAVLDGYDLEVFAPRYGSSYLNL